MNKKIPLWFVLLLLWFALIVILTFGWDVWRIKTSRQGVTTKTDRIIIAIASFPSLVKESFKEIGKPSTLVSPVLYQNINGLKTEKKYIDSNYILLSTYDKKVNQSVARSTAVKSHSRTHLRSDDTSVDFIMKYDHTNARKEAVRGRSARKPTSKNTSMRCTFI